MNVFTEFPEARRVELERNKRIKIAYLYHGDDFSFFDSFYRRHLSVLRRQNKISDDLPDVPAGTPFQEYMRPLFENAHSIILFLSGSVESDEEERSSSEMIALIKACHEKGIRIWKVVARYYYLEGSVYREYGEFLGKGKVIVSNSSSSDEVLSQIVSEIDEEVAEMLAEEWVQEGNQYYHKMCFDEALAAYDNSLYYVSGYPPALLGKWRIFRKKSMLADAEQCLEKLLSLNTLPPQKGKDGLSLVSQRISLIRSYCKGCASLDTSAFNNAHTAFREVFQRITSPIDKLQKKLCARAYCGEGDTFVSEGRRAYDFTNYYNQALTAYQTARQLDSDDLMYLTRIGDAHVAFAEAYARLNDRTQVRSHCYDALKNYEQVVSRSSYPPAFVGQGDVYFLLQQFHKALEYYEAALSYDQYITHAYGEKGNILLAFNKPEEALHAFEQALSIDDSDARYYYGKGQALTRLRHYQDALESYKMAVRYGIRQSKEFLVDYARALIELGDIESMYGQGSEANKCYAKAQDFYQRIFALGSNEKDIKYGCGRIFFVRKNWDVALAFYNEAISIAVDMSEAYLGMGKTYFKLGNDKKAFDCFESARQWSRRSKSMIDEADVETAYGDVLYDIAEYHTTSDTYENFLENVMLHYKKAIHIRENAMAYAGLGKTYAGLRRDQEAIDALNRALELMPNLVQCYFIKGNCYYYLGRYSEAYVEYEKAYKAGLDTVPLQKAFGEVLLVMKRYKDALQIINATINHMYSDIDAYKDQDFAYILCNKGIALHGQGEDGKAILCFFKAYGYDQSISWERQYRQVLEDIYYNCQKKLSVNPDSSVLYKYKGDVLRLLGEENEKIINAYTAAIAYGDTSADTYYSRGLIYEKLRDYQNAFNDYCTVLQIDQNHQAAQQAKLRVESKIIQPQTSFWQKFKPLLKLFS